MADAIRDRMRAFLRIEPAHNAGIMIYETLDHRGNMAKNRIWYRGDADELAQLYRSIPGSSTQMRFWASVPRAGREIQKLHTGLPGIIVDTLVSVIVPDINEPEMDDRYKSDWDLISKENSFSHLLEHALSETLVTGDGVFRIGFNTDISAYPILDFVSGEHVDLRKNRGRLSEIEVRTEYCYEKKEYTLVETYRKGSLESRLYLNGTQIPLATIPHTANTAELVTWEGDYMLAVPFRIYESKRYPGRGGSIFDGKTDSFDALDEAWSQWMDALRKGRTKEYIPSNILPRDPETGVPLKPSAFDSAFIVQESSMQEGAQQQVQVVQPEIRHESYLSTYITALDLCLQGVISPSTLGIDTKKMDNAEAQREKEKTTLYTRNRIIEAMQDAVPELVRAAVMAMHTAAGQAVEDFEVSVSFGEYANPSFESQVETLSKAKTGGIMSIEAIVEELYGDSKDKDWKEEEIARLKAEQGLEELEEPSLNLEGVEIGTSGGAESTKSGADAGNNSDAGNPAPGSSAEGK